MSIEQGNQIRALAKRVEELEKLVQALLSRVNDVENAVTAPERRGEGDVLDKVWTIPDQDAPYVPQPLKTEKRKRA